MTDLKDTEVAVDLLKKLGSKWAVLTAMSAKMREKGIDVPLAANEDSGNRNRVRLLLTLRGQLFACRGRKPPFLKVPSSR